MVAKLIAHETLPTRDCNIQKQTFNDGHEFRIWCYGRKNNMKRINISTTIYISYNLHLYNYQTSYEYHLQHLLYKREGDVYGRLYQADINIVVTVDLNEYLLILDSIKFTNVR